ncbi:MAG: hypothetical protein KGD63_01295 [Candidatus Lokiarchaeota archaeon]|nr:hypothetical protein [Candidatus Lokiarchaeota archaeon]
MEDSEKTTFYGLALIVSLIGAILILVTEFAGYWTSGEWGWIGVDSAAAAILVPLAIFLFYSTIINLILITKPDRIPNKNLIKYAKLLCFVTFLLFLIGGIAYAIIIELEEVESWWFGAGFYGGIIGSLLSFLFMYIAEKY